MKHRVLLSGAVAGVFAMALAGTAAARDLTVESWGGAYQDAQREVYFKPYMAQTKSKMLEESWDGGVGSSHGGLPSAVAELRLHDAPTSRTTCTSSFKRRTERERLCRTSIVVVTVGRRSW